MSNRKPVEIAPGVHWYSAGAVAGNIYFVQSASSWVLIDTATAGQGRRIREAAAMLFGVGARPAAILLKTAESGSPTNDTRPAADYFRSRLPPQPTRRLA